MNNIIIGIVDGCFTSLSMLPQLIKIIKEKKAENISVPAFVVLLTGLALWITYGLLKEDWPLIITNIATLLINLLMIILSVRYRSEG